MRDVTFSRKRHGKVVQEGMEDAFGRKRGQKHGVTAQRASQTDKSKHLRYETLLFELLTTFP